ncbi:hypothetical protein Back11_41070 [Paenibacillus baekrokdamisoli]|uniref:Uncharacterized protein n=1 Tax=Paenibacillus baekrokdamisoli TaxID=1712516 RepID=A0A3G9IWU1_9BACL|nr:hypothetical protein [Paenibacillus baekrokdamisoli]MBB3068194.1 hypothetical protein [Paenibacillus baekrokdamisoli]BBH22762.1 hypothetical protein Back11_41070 [Paenibacillus baekrokdamisoli]
MSAKLKFKNIKAARTGRARISNTCCNQKDQAVEAMQEAGADLCDLFCQLKNANVAAKLVRAIRCRNRRGVEALIGTNCNVVTFFHQGNNSCVRISCVFGECCNVRITFDICVSGGHCNNLSNINNNHNHC